MTDRRDSKGDDTSDIIRFVAVKAAIFIVLPAMLAALAVYLTL